MIICPVCKQKFKRIIITHVRSHGLTIQEFHKLRIEAEYGVPIKEFLLDIYINQRLGSPEIFRRYSLTYRMLRDLLAMCKIEMRTMSEAIAASWEGADVRREETARVMRRTNLRFHLTHETPSKRPDVRRKISAAKKANNPGLKPMLMANRERRLANPTKSEQIMMSALDAAGISYEREFIIGRYFIDFAIPRFKIAVEVDGTGWHDPVRDAIRDARLEQRGWKVFRYSTHSVRSDISECIDDLVARLNEMGIDPTMAR